MGRYTGPKCRLCRREGTKLFLKGDRCYSDKCAMNRRPYPPGQHGRYRRRLTGYAIRLREKQKLKRIYGIREEQFRRYIEEAQKVKGRTGTALLRILEERLDNVVTDIPSYRVEPGDVIEVKPQSKDKLRELIKEAAEKRNLPSWLTRDLENLRIQVTAEPAEEDLDKSIDMNLIVEFYSR